MSSTYAVVGMILSFLCGAVGTAVVIMALHKHMTKFSDRQKLILTAFRGDMDEVRRELHQDSRMTSRMVDVLDQQVALFRSVDVVDVATKACLEVFLAEVESTRLRIMAVDTHGDAVRAMNVASNRLETLKLTFSYASSERYREPGESQ